MLTRLIFAVKAGEVRIEELVTLVEGGVTSSKEHPHQTRIP
jgi:hypothetical protein